MQGCTVTKGIVAMRDKANEVFVAVRDYTDFTEDNDPYGEHDFGSLKVAGEKVFWKIDYYDENLKNWCDPLDPDCQRVLTIMLTEEYRKSLETKIERLTRMDDMLYVDKLAGGISKERYEAKRKDIQEQLQTVKDDLLIADSTVAQKHNETISLIKLTQTAKDEYLDADMSREEKLSILTELFESVTLKDNSVSVKYTFFAQSVAKRSPKTRKILGGVAMLNRTEENDQHNRGEFNKKDLKNEIYPVWQW